MKNILSVLGIILIISCFLSCDGRERFHTSPETVLKEKNLLDAFSEDFSYIPENYAEKVTDSIYANGYRVYLKQYTNNLKEVTVKPTNNKENKTKVYRDFNVDLKVTLNNKTLHERTLNTNMEIIYGKYFDTKNHNYILRNVWSNAKNINQPNSPFIVLELYNPKTLDVKEVQITILENKLLFT